MALDRTVTAAALAALALGVAADAALGSLTWSAPRPLGGTYTTYNGMDGEMASGGAAALGWDADTTAVVSVAPAGEPFGPPHVFASSRNPSVAVSGTGAAVAVMAAEGGPGVIVSHNAGGGWSTPETLDAVSVSSAIGMDAEGRAVVAWRDANDGSMHAARMTADGDWGAGEEIAPADAGAQDPRLATAPDGVTTVVWTTGSGPVTQVLTSMSDGGPWSAPEEIGSVTGFAVMPQLYGSPIQVGPGGEATVVWSEGAPGGWVPRAVRRSGGVWSDLPPLPAIDAGTGVVWPVRAADGTLHVVSAAIDTGWSPADRWRFSRLAPGGAAWSDEPVTPGPGGDFTPLATGGEAPGGGVVWARLAATTSGAGGLGPVEIMGGAGGDATVLGDRAAGAVVLGSPSRALAVWAVPENADGTGTFELSVSEGTLAPDPAPAPPPVDAVTPGPPAPAVSTPAPALDRTPPVLRIGRMRAATSSAPRRGRTLSATVTLSEAARIQGALRRIRPGARPVVVRRVTLDLPAGTSRIALGRVPAGAGRYRLTLSAVDAAGNAGAEVLAEIRRAPARCARGRPGLTGW